MTHEIDRSRKKEEERTPPTPSGGDSDFDEWYATYPLHVARGAALRAYRGARKKASREVLLSGARVMAKAHPKGTNYCPHPATWLNGERWADELPPPVEGGARVHSQNEAPPADVTADPDRLEAWFADKDRGVNPWVEWEARQAAEQNGVLV